MNRQWGSGSYTTPLQFPGYFQGPTLEIIEIILYDSNMPGRNVIKHYASESYYHVYNRGIDKSPIFLDKQDYSVFINLFKRYLSSEPVIDNKGREYPWLKPRIQLLAFCLMPNHFHMLVLQEDEKAITDLIRYITTSFSMYFNKKYRRRGPVFENRFRAVHIDSQQYLDHISRYIHLNPGRTRYKSWEWSSISYYEGKKEAVWLNTMDILDMFDSKEQYLKFVNDYKELHDELEIIQHELADH